MTRHFFKTLREYVSRHAPGNVTTEDLVAVAEEVAGQGSGRSFRFLALRRDHSTSAGKGQRSGKLATRGLRRTIALAMLEGELGCPLSLKTPNMGNPGIDGWYASK